VPRETPETPGVADKHSRSRIMKRWRIFYYSGLILITGMLINTIANA